MPIRKLYTVFIKGESKLCILQVPLSFRGTQGVQVKGQIAKQHHHVRGNQGKEDLHHQEELLEPLFRLDSADDPG